MQKYINYTVSRKVVMEHRHSREMISFYYKSNKQLVCKQSHNISWKGMQKWPRDYLQALAAQVMSAFVFIFSEHSDWVSISLISLVNVLSAPPHALYSTCYFCSAIIILTTK